MNDDQEPLDQEPLHLKTEGISIVLYPSTVLSNKCRIVKCPESMSSLAQQMLQLMYRKGGVGLAAPQIGLDINMVVMNHAGSTRYKAHEKAIINPRLISSSGTKREREGCLSIPRIRGRVKRPTDIEVEYQDLSGKTVTGKIRGFEARVFLHEFDHLEGLLLVDKMSAAEKAFYAPQLKILEQSHG